MRKQTVACVFIGIMIVLGAATTQLFAQSVVLTDTEIKEDNAAVKMLFSTNKSISIECYDLSEPPQIVIDFMGEIYTNRPEVSMVNKGVVKQIRVVRGTKKSTDLDDSFYSVDFIIVDLTEPVRYDFDQGLTNSVLLISRPGKSLEASAEAKEAAPVVQQSPAAPETTAGINPEMKKQESIPLAAAEQEMRQEPEPAVGVSLKAETAEPETVPESAQPKATSANKVSRRTKEVGGGISKGISKFGAGIKNLVTFGKNKKTTPAQASITEKPKVEDSTAVSKKKTRKRVDKSGDKSKKLIAATGKKEVKRRKWKKKTESGSEASDVYVAESGSADTATRLEQARQMLAKCEADLKTAQGEVDSAYAAVENSLENQRTLGMRIALAQEKQKAAEADMNQSVRIIELAKNAANSVWLEYSAAKNELTNLLDQGGENSLVSAAQKKYDSSKAALENALNAVDQAKKDSDAKAAAYETAKKELESLKMSAQDPAKDVTGAQKRYEQNKERLSVMEKKVAQARQEVANAERAHKQYELEKADAEYKKSLQAIDSSLASKLEEERLQNEARQRKVEEDNAREKARLAALEKLQTAQKPEEVQVVPEDESAKAVAPKRRMAQAPVKKTSAPQSVRSEVLKSAVELRNAGLEMQRNGDMDSAVKYYQQALMQDPNYATVHNDLGILYEQKGLDEKAKTEYMEALRIDKYYLRAHSNLALLYEKLGDYDKAHYHWKQRVQLGKSDDPWTQKARERMEALEKRK